MSKKVQKSPKKGAKDNKQSSFPQCINKKQARMVCLNQQCEEHPFFCASCDDSSCEIVHQHDDKLISVSFKEFTKRVLKQRKPIDSLGQSIDSYRQVLQKLKEDVTQFIEKQLNNLEQIVKKAEEVPEEDAENIQKLRAHQYQGFTGAVLDKLWSSCAQDPQKVQGQQETAQFIKIKQEQVRGISQHFQHLNKMQIDNLPENEQQTPKNKKNKQPVAATKSKK